MKIRLIFIFRISGVTANPSIFEKAINSSSDYDEDITEFSKQIGSNDDIFIDLAVEDIGTNILGTNEHSNQFLIPS